MCHHDEPIYDQPECPVAPAHLFLSPGDPNIAGEGNLVCRYCGLVLTRFGDFLYPQDGWKSINYRKIQDWQRMSNLKELLCIMTKINQASDFNVRVPNIVLFDKEGSKVQPARVQIYLLSDEISSVMQEIMDSIPDELLGSFHFRKETITDKLSLLVIEVYP